MTKTARFLLLLAAPLLCNLNHTLASGKIAAHLKDVMAREKIQNFEPFKVVAPSGNEAFLEALPAFTLMNSNGSLNDLIRQAPELIRISLPYEQSQIRVILYKTDISPNGFSLLTDKGAVDASQNTVLHYRGILEHNENSVAAFSFSKEETMGLISGNNGTLVFGKTDNDAAERYILYNAAQLQNQQPFDCSTMDIPGAPLKTPGSINQSQSLKCVDWYWETDYDVFVNKGSTANVNAYMQGIFNQVSTLYANDGISITLQTLFVWTTTDPFTGPSTNDYLTQFGVTRTSFAGDLAQLIGFNGGGGVAWINGLCNSQAKYKQGYSGISTTYNTVPTYSWTVEVITHEQGHQLGSRHTHDCVWNGNNTPIDGCGPAAGYSSGTCAAGPIPVKGTIMSYCHLLSGTGIDLALGFGPQPAALMLNNVNNSSCLSACSGCVPPAQPGAISGTATPCSTSTVTYSIAAVATATSYQWTLPSGWSGSSSGTSITVTTGTSGGTISVTAINSCGSSPAVTKSVTVSGTLPTLPNSITTTGGIARVCQGDTRTYTTSAQTGVTYVWTVPAGAVINSGQGTNSINVTYTAAFSANGNITVGKQNSCGTGPLRSLSITRNTPATPGAMSGSAYGLCGLSNMTYSVTPVAGMTYNWVVPAGAVITGGQGTSAVTVNFPAVSLSGNITVNASNACGTSANRIKSVKTVPDKPASISGPVTACPNTTGIPFSVSPVANATSYTWAGPTGSTITANGITSTGTTLTTTATSVTYSFNALNSTFSIYAKAVNACGSGSNAVKSMNSSGCRMGEEDTDAHFNVYPNPASDQLTISLSATTSSDCEIIFTDLSGKVVYTESRTITDGSNFLQLETASFARGMYILTLRTAENTHHRKVQFN